MPLKEAAPKIRAQLLLVMLLAVGSARAQAPTGTISGVVTDSAGAHVAGARVRLTNRAFPQGYVRIVLRKG